MIYISSIMNRGAGWIMDYGFHGFHIHNVHNLWIWNGYGITKPLDDGFEMDMKSQTKSIIHNP